MTERLTASLEDGTLEKLRTLAGGERKVGVFLSDVVAMLWRDKEELDTTGVAGCMIVQTQKVKNFLGTDKETALQLVQGLQAELQRLEAEALQEARAMREAYAQLMLRTVQLEQRLATQEDGGHNDA